METNLIRVRQVNINEIVLPKFKVTFGEFVAWYCCNLTRVDEMVMTDLEETDFCPMECEEYFDNDWAKFWNFVLEHEQDEIEISCIDSTSAFENTFVVGDKEFVCYSIDYMPEVREVEICDDEEYDCD